MDSARSSSGAFHCLFTKLWCANIDLRSREIAMAFSRDGQDRDKRGHYEFLLIEWLTFDFLESLLLLIACGRLCRAFVEAAGSARAKAPDYVPLHELVFPAPGYG
jgi:hypothetical protein